jgi:hypothetical protein
MGRTTPAPYELGSFVAPWNAQFDFMTDETGAPSAARRSIVLFGPPATGKTCRALCEFGRPLLCNTIEAARNVVRAGPSATTHLVFDEANFLHLEPEACINLLDSFTEHDVPARYSDVRLPAIPRIFVTNKPMRWSFPNGHIFRYPELPAHRAAIARRMKLVEVEGPMFA